MREKAQAVSPARPKVPVRQTGTDCLVVAVKRSNVRRAKGAGHSRHDLLVNWQQEEPTDCGEGRQPSVNGTSRVMGDYHARFCERLGVQLPGRLGGGQQWLSLPRQLSRSVAV